MLWLSLFVFTALAAPADSAHPSAEALGAQSFLETLPPAPSAAEVEGWDPVQYNDYLVHTHFRWAGELTRRLREEVGRVSDSTIQDRVRPLAAFARLARTNAASVPAFRGDGAFREAIVAAYDTLAVTIERDFPPMWTLFTQTQVRNADLTEAERRYAAMLDECDRADARTHAAQADFARENGFVLVVKQTEAPPVDTGPAFAAPGLPPAGSRLPAVQHVNFALRYHNALVAHQSALTEATNAFISATGGDADALEQIRRESLVAVRAELKGVRATEAWQGDDTLRATILAYGTELEALLEDLSAYTALRKKATLTEAEHATYVRLSDAVGTRTQSANAGFTAGQQRFLERWGILAYEAWRAAQAPTAGASAQGTPAP